MDKQYLFGPKNDKDLKRQYPELGNQPEFKNLTVGELLFCWWYANPTSPLVRDNNSNEKERVKLAYEQSFKNAPNQDRYAAYMAFLFPDKMKQAIDRMKRFDASVRMRAKNIIETILENYEKLADVDLKDFVEEEKDETGKIRKKINWTGRNNYVTSASTISKALPDLIQQVENGFGVTETKGSGEDGITKAIQRFHSTNND